MNALHAAPELSDFAKMLVRLMMKERAKDAEQEYGPHLIWASQLGPAYFEESRRELEANKAEERRRNVSLGQLRRARQEKT